MFKLLFVIDYSNSYCWCCISDNAFYFQPHCYQWQGRSKVFTIGQVSVNPEHYVIKCVADDYLFNGYVAFLSLAVFYSKSIKPTNNVALCLLHNSCTIEYLVLCMHEQPITFHFIILLFYLLYHNITSFTSPNITLVASLNI